MYYVIKKQQGSPFITFISFQVSKYIASKNNDNVIFEFIRDTKVQRKWVKKSDIILLTDDKDFFIKTVEHLKSVEIAQQKLVDVAQEQLNQSIETFTETMNEELNELNEIKDSDVSCILKGMS